MNALIASAAREDRTAMHTELVRPLAVAGALALSLVGSSPVPGEALTLQAGPGAAARDGADATAGAEAEAPFGRFPAVSPDGRTVAFAYQGDIFTVPVEGGPARRLTLHEAYERRPRWSPDGARIAFESDRHGNDDLFVMRADGSQVRRLTWHSAPDALGGWTPDGRIVFETDRTWQQVERENEIYAVSAEPRGPRRTDASSPSSSAPTRGPERDIAGPPTRTCGSTTRRRGVTRSSRRTSTGTTSRRHGRASAPSCS